MRARVAIVIGGYVRSSRAISRAADLAPLSASEASKTRLCRPRRLRKPMPEPLPGRRGPPLVALVHPHERGDVHALVDLAAQSRSAPAIEHVGVALAPGRVRDLGDHRFERPRRRVAEQEAHRVEPDPQVARVGEQPDRRRRGGARAARRPGRARHRRAARPRRRGSRPAKPRGRRPAGRPERELVEDLGQLAEVEQRHEDAVAEPVLDRAQPAVDHPPLVDRGRPAHAASASRRGLHAQRLGHAQGRPDAVLVEAPAPVGPAVVGPVAAADLGPAALGGDAGARVDGVGVVEAPGSPAPGRSPRSGSG